MTFKKRSDVLLSLAALLALLASAGLPTPSAGTPAERFGQVLAFNTSEQRVLPMQRLALGTTTAASFALAAANNRAAVVDPLRSELRIVDTVSGMAVMSRRLDAAPSVVGIDDWGSLAVVGYSQRDDLSIINLDASSPDRNISLPSPPGILRVARTNHKVIATLPRMNAIAVVDLRSGTSVQISVDRNPSSLALDPASNRALVCNYEDGTLSIIDLLTNTMIATVPIGRQPTDVVVDSGSRIAYVACAGSGLIERFDLVRLAPLGSLNSEIIKGLSRLALFPEHPKGIVRALLVASSLAEGALTVFNLAQNTRWRIETGDEISDLIPSGLTGEVMALANRSEVVAWDLRRLSPPVLELAERFTPEAALETGFVLRGHNFQTAQNDANGQPARFSVSVGNLPASTAQLVDDSTATVPWKGELRRTPIKATTANGDSNEVFLRDSELVPRMKGVVPAVGPESGGTRCTVKGDNFLDGSPGTTAVFFGISPATDVVIVDENTITCTAPAGTDRVTVRVQ
ncbi:MAG: IPT/TIG domain-containing protein, partial [Gammaproteobacteria bacterium]